MAQSPKPPLLPSGALPDGLGCNIHFTDPRPGEMAMMAAAGFTWVRMDFDWNQVEYERGRYRFDAYDRLMSALEHHGMRPIFILDYVHRFYDDAQSPHSDEAIAAFARFAGASAQHFAGRGVLWEMYNEPNIYPFWRPKPNVNDYIRLALATGKAIRKAAPGEAYIGPATSLIDLAFIEPCLKAGLLTYWDAISVHPYRQTEPETVLAEYAKLRDMVRRYAPRGKTVPIISGEWGYSSAWQGMTVEKQGKMLARQWLTNISQGVPLSIWYDWHDDGPDPKEPEHHFGAVLHPYHEGREPVYDPKPAYVAARTLAEQLKGFRFSKRLIVGDRTDFVLVFTRGRDVRMAAWTTSSTPREVVVPSSAGVFRLVDHVGTRLPDATARAASPGAARSGTGVPITLRDAPVYVAPAAPDPVWSTIADWAPLPLDTYTAFTPRVRIGAALRNRTDAVLEVTHQNRRTDLAPGKALTPTAVLPAERSATPILGQLHIRVNGSAPIVQETRVVVSDPLVVEMRPPSGGRLPLSIGNPSGRPFHGSLVLTLNTNGVRRAERTNLKLRSAQLSADLSIPAPAAEAATISGAVLDSAGATVLRIRPTTLRTALPEIRAAPDGSPQGLMLLTDGDPKVASEQTLRVAEPPAGPPATGMNSISLRYRFDAGWKFVRVTPGTGMPHTIAGKPQSVGVWIHGDGAGNIPRLRFVDSTEQTFQPDGEPILWKGWRWVTFPLDGSRSGRWGGAADGVVHHPIRWDTLFLLDSAGGRATSGEVHFAGITLIYDQEE